MWTLAHENNINGSLIFCRNKHLPIFTLFFHLWITICLTHTPINLIYCVILFLTLYVINIIIYMSIFVCRLSYAEGQNPNFCKSFLYWFNFPSCSFEINVNLLASLKNEWNVWENLSYTPLSPGQRLSTFN